MEEIDLVMSQVDSLRDGVMELYDSALARQHIDWEFIEQSKIIRRIKEDVYLIGSCDFYDEILETDMACEIY